MVVVCVGGIFYAMSTFVNSPILISIGGVFLTIGLALYAAFLAWQLNDVIEELSTDDPKKFETNSEDRAILGIVAMSVTLIGIVFFVIKAIQRNVKPYFGPANYNLYGSLLFGAGVFTYLLLNISFTEDVKDDDDFDPLLNSDKYGAVLFCSGSLLLFLASARSYYAMDLQVINDFPAITALEMNPVQSLLMFIGASILAVSSFLLITGDLLTAHDDRSD
mmetsp:Transcript_19249/g.32209  ORF Transcript_19249/g.32209 Transcript_19249/m.32209 type:complete len:220 (-) Transcript_19249:262-921(-)